ncbi:MAG: MBOAT family protein [Leptolyngbyaceae cyanobacterium SM1_1_3]|nr:MBOAT family protein [Leptolyngbyaceae cyanobacterium SM1_1_3]NJN01319.1 MBOAT family protein [Leptolyngbyaceae cyanobacterium RM1_1_2]NJO09921.1 MBOAT family protein [Leptolyngbyaceae cyanobacterium SL_1_1]
MLFNSYEFILLFLPVTVLIFYQSVKVGGHKLAVIWLTIASLFFYGYWNPPYLILLLISIAINYILGQLLAEFYQVEREKQGKLLLTLGIIFNLGLIGYYKYFNFFIDNLNGIGGTSFFVENILLPLGISFYTFQQVSYLVDSAEGETKGYKFIDYCLFVSFFPQLIAGPIVSHQEMMPQFSKKANFGFKQENLVVGITIFSIGLFKKVILADQIALYSTPVFQAADSSGIALTFAEAWIGALAYTLQIYFDFSGYSDMAIGAARTFGVVLPINFNSPYKAVNIIDFWQRWHMTLTRFLTRYLYNPIVLNLSRRRIRQGKSLIKRGVGSLSAYLELIAVPTLITMFLAGLWHGAGWQYIVFGLLHGLYLSINHGWRILLKSLHYNPTEVAWWQNRLGHLVTFGCVIVAMVFFRAPSVGNGLTVLSAMIGVNGISFSDGALFSNQLFDNAKLGLLWLLVLMAIAFLTPNTQEWLSEYNPALGYQTTSKKQTYSWLIYLQKYLKWQPNQAWAVITAAIAVTGFLGISGVSEFIYFQF